jgi:hypothetical protein
MNPLGTIGKIVGSGFDSDKWRLGLRPTPLFVAHLLFTLVKIMQTFLVVITFFWAWWTTWNAIDSTAWLLLLDLFSVTLFITTLMPIRKMPTVWEIGFGFMFGLISLVATILFLILFGDAAWNTHNIYTNATTDLVNANARTLLLVTWFFALCVGVPGTFLQMIYFPLNLIAYWLEVATPAGLAYRAVSVVSSVFGMKRLAGI